jgi:hypothetical protein
MTTQFSNYTYVTDKDKTGQITEFRLTFSDEVLANYTYQNKLFYGFKNVSITKRDGNYCVNWDRK